MAAKTSWHRYGTNLRHCHPVCGSPSCKGSGFRTPVEYDVFFDHPSLPQTSSSSVGRVCTADPCTRVIHTTTIGLHATFVVDLLYTCSTADKILIDMARQIKVKLRYTRTPAVRNTPHRYENSLAIWDRTVLPATRHR